MMIRSIDIEDKAREVLGVYYTTYCPPLPAEYELPFIRVSCVGGTEDDFIDTFRVTVEGYAETEAEACEITRNAIGILKEGVWACQGESMPVSLPDPLRPDLCRYRTTVRITEYQEYFTL